MSDFNISNNSDNTYIYIYKDIIEKSNTYREYYFLTSLNNNINNYPYFNSFFMYELYNNNNNIYILFFMRIYNCPIIFIFVLDMNFYEFLIIFLITINVIIFSTFILIKYLF